MRNFKLSSYVIDIPLEESENKHMLIHGYSGAIDVINSDIVAFLKNNKENLSIETFPYSESTWDSLIKRSYITEKTRSEEIDFVKKFADLMHRQSQLLKSFGFLVSYDCNFRCPYCYEAQISDFGNHWEKKKFTKELVDKVFSMFEKIESNRSLHNNSLLLYGGEPLLKENKEVVSYIVKKGCDLGYSFSTITNGYDLEEYKDLLAPDKIGRIQITIDGWKDTHNVRRVHMAGFETFDKIVQNAKMALEQGIYVSIRMNTDYSNFDGIEKLKSHFEKLGLYEHKKFHFYTALMVDYLQEHKNEEAENLGYMSRKEFSNKNANLDCQSDFEDWGISNRLFKAMKNKEFLSFSSIYCSAQSGSYIFDPEQRIYSCWESLGRKDTIVGDYSGDDIIWTPFLKKIQGRNISKQEQCYKCKYSFLCRGGCASISLKKKGDMNFSFCNDYPYVFKIAANRAYKRYRGMDSCNNNLQKVL